MGPAWTKDEVRGRSDRQDDCRPKSDQAGRQPGRVEADVDIHIDEPRPDQQQGPAWSGDDMSLAVEVRRVKVIFLGQRMVPRRLRRCAIHELCPRSH